MPAARSTPMHRGSAVCGFKSGKRVETETFRPFFQISSHAVVAGDALAIPAANNAASENNSLIIITLRQFMFVPQMSQV